MVNRKQSGHRCLQIIFSTSAEQLNILDSNNSILLVNYINDIYEIASLAGATKIRHCKPNCNFRV